MSLQKIGNASSMGERNPYQPLDYTEILHDARLAEIEFHAPSEELESQLVEAFGDLSLAIKNEQDARKVMQAATTVVSLVGKYAEFNQART